MSTNFEENKDRIVNELNKKISNLKCPVCGLGPLTLGGGFFAHDLQQDLSQRQLGGVNIPTVPIICKHCGYVMEFAAGSLGLLPPDSSSGKLSESSQTTEEKNEK